MSTGPVHFTESARRVRPSRALRVKLTLRAFQFWTRVAGIYGSYKLTQLRLALAGGLMGDHRRAWHAQHDWAARSMYNMCSEMRGFLVKAGQFLATRADFLPEPFIQRLSKLHDDVDPMSPTMAKRVIVDALAIEHISDFFDHFDEEPIGAASVSQVHRAQLRRDRLPRGLGRHVQTNGWVAVKVQYPEAEMLMVHDLSSLLSLARFLQKYELPFDLESPILELQSQIRQEFDFIREANNTMRVRERVRRCGALRARIQIPEIYYAKRRVLIMEFLDGIPILSLANETSDTKVRPNKHLRQVLERSLWDTVSMIYGKMLLGDGFFQADPHPGNILVMRKNLSRKRLFSRAMTYLVGRRPVVSIGLVDFGQCKQLSAERVHQMRRLMRALHAGKGISKAFFDLGITLETDSIHFDNNDIETLAYSMFDSRPLPGGKSISPFGETSPLKNTPVKHMPGDLFFVLRTIQILRGMQSRLDSLLHFSLATDWCGSRHLCGTPLDH